MNVLERTLARTMRNNDFQGKVYIMPGQGFVNVSPVIEWEKWLSYEPEFQKKRIKELENKTLLDASLEELQKIITYKKEQKYASLFQNYIARKCSIEECNLIYDYMKSENIEILMRRKLTKEEMLYARNEIIRIGALSDGEICDKVQREKKYEVYKQLSMIDAYILHQIANDSYARSIEKEKMKRKQI